MKPIHCLSLICLQLFISVSIASASNPANDNFLAAIAVESGTGVSATGNDANATLEANENTPASVYTGSVWFQWTANESEPVYIDVLGTDFFFPRKFSVWSGTSLDDLSLIAENNLPRTSVDAFITGIHVEATSGQTYYISVYSGDVEGGDFRLDVSKSVHSSIRGTVLLPDESSPAEGIVVQPLLLIPGGDRSTFQHWEWVPNTVTDADGDYELEGLPPGIYRLGFFDSDGEFSAYPYQYYNKTEPSVDPYQHYHFDRDPVFVTDFVFATDIPVGESESISDIDITLRRQRPTATIAGTVTGSDGVTPLEDIFVDVYRWDSDRSEWLNVTLSPFLVIGSDGHIIIKQVTRADGKFTTSALLPGVYRVKFTDYGDTYVTEYFDNQVSIEQASDIVIRSDESVTGIDASLSTYSWISGKIPETSLKMIQHSSTGAEVSLSWKSQLDALYSIEFTTDFKNWETIGSSFRGTGEVMTFEHNNSVNEDRVGFFRLVTESTQR